MSETSLPQFEKCNGQIVWQDHVLPIVFSLTWEEDGRVAIELPPVPISTESSFLFDLFGAGGRTLDYFTIRGTGPDGSTIRTDYAALTTCGTRSSERGTFFDLKASIGLLDLIFPAAKLDERPTAARFEYYILGLKCFGNPSGNAAFGKVTISSGTSDPQDYAKITGVVSVDLSSPEQLQLEEEQVDFQVGLVLDVLSLAEGRFMDWSVRKRFADSKLRSVRFRGATGSTDPQFPLFSHLDLGPILDVALQNYTAKLCEETGADLAIKIAVTNPRYAEVRFLTGMTAIEHMIHVFKKKHKQSRLIPKKLFKCFVRRRLESELNAAFEDIQERRELKDRDKKDWTDERKIMSQKLGNLNQRSLQTNLEAMLQHYQVPLNGIKEHISDLVKLRNDIVHRGHRSEGQQHLKLDFCNAVLRELLVRIFLSVLRYNGGYQSYLDGPEWRVFPS